MGRHSAHDTSWFQSPEDQGNAKVELDMGALWLAESELNQLGRGTLYMPLMHILRALQWGDSTLPVGAFSFSAGLEAAVQCQVVKNAEDLRAFTRTALWQSAGSDAVAVACALSVALAGNWEELTDMDHAVLTRKASEENRLMTQRMGKKLAEHAVSVAKAPMMAQWLEQIRSGHCPGTWPVTQGILFATLGMGDEVAVAVHQYGLMTTILNASLRLMRVTHLDTQSILFDVSEEIPGQCQKAVNTPWRHMASFAPMNDILAAQHSYAHVRLFMN